MAERTLAEVREWAGRLLDPHGHNCTITPRYVDAADCGDTDLEYRGALGKFAAATGDSSEVLSLMCEAPCLARELLRLADLAEAQAAELERLRGLAEIIGPMPENTSATAYPYWLIIDPVQMMRPTPMGVASMVSGPFLSREDADAHMASRRHAFSDRAVVWCHSGHASVKWREVCRIRVEMRGEATDAD